MDIDELLDEVGIKVVPGTLKPNYREFPIITLSPTQTNAEIFNKMYHACKDDPDFFTIERTPSGGISTKMFFLPAYDIAPNLSFKGKFKAVELTVITAKHMARVQFGQISKTGLSGTVAFRKFWSTCKKFGINLKDYSIPKEEGLKIKEDIPKPHIGLTSHMWEDLIFTNVHHIDFHSSYPSGLMITHPELKDPIEFLYKERHKSEKYKDVMNLAIGYMQSSYVGYRYTKLAYDAIKNNNERIEAITKKLDDGEHTVLMYNTDGIWYCGEPYHDEDEGDGLGKWRHDHMNCTFRAKNDGVYEFIEDGKYYPRVRGRTAYETKVPRENWVWGDIYNKDCNPLIFRWDEEGGIIHEIH